MEGSLPAPTDSWREYVTALENRLQQLEARLQEFETKLPEQPDALEALPEGLPDTQLLSTNFLRRAFAIWGHMIVAQLIITVPFYCLFFLMGILSNQ
jgi:hypothetical protein